MPPRQREEVVNVVLAECICESGINAAPETIRDRAMPDVFIAFRGLRCVVEGKFADVQNAAEVVAGDASGRVDAGIAHMAIDSTSGRGCCC